jgi:hypothetical protein
LLLVDRAMNLDLTLRMEFQGCNEDATELHVNGEAGAENAEFSEMLDRLELVATDGECTTIALKDQTNPSEDEFS